MSHPDRLPGLLDTERLKYPERTDYSTPATEWFTHLTHPNEPLPPKLFLTDIDGVLVDWILAFEIWATAKLGKHPNIPLHYHMDLREWLTPGDLEAGQRMIEEFQISDTAGRLPPYPDALEWIPKIHQDFGYHFAAISTAGGHPQIAARRVETVERYFGTDIFRAFHILPPLTSKSLALEHYVPRFESQPFVPWVDDMIRQTTPAVKLGFQSWTLLRDPTEFDAAQQAYAANPDLLAKPVTSWEEIYQLLCVLED